MRLTAALSRNSTGCGGTAPGRRAVPARLTAPLGRRRVAASADGETPSPSRSHELSELREQSLGRIDEPEATKLPSSQRLKDLSGVDLNVAPMYQPLDSPQQGGAQQAQRGEQQAQHGEHAQEQVQEQAQRGGQEEPGRQGQSGGSGGEEEARGGGGGAGGGGGELSLAPPGAPPDALELLRQLEERPVTNVDEARGLGPEQGEDFGGGPLDRPHPGDGSRGPTGAEPDAPTSTLHAATTTGGSDDLNRRGGREDADGEGGGGGGGFAGAEALWGLGGGEAVALTALDTGDAFEARAPEARAGAGARPRAQTRSAPVKAMGREDRVREVEECISGGAANTGAALSHLEPTATAAANDGLGGGGGGGGGGRAGGAAGGWAGYRGHLAADAREVAEMGSQSAVRAVEAAISLPRGQPGASSGGGQSPLVADAPGSGQDPGSGSSSGGLRGAAAAAVDRVEGAAEAAAGAAVGAAKYVRNTARTTGQLLGNAAMHIAEDVQGRNSGVDEP
ncbi:hypothetical protein HYH03_005759 [Edaphochlamys debaryana]|uniref:Uncharacterized protein n=1 Tax=Edaphochlamys debaryana TaxID=47281 RepID=A0A835Y494_9CHLO|nr:hypothetical protein HYH03_005759 [Edaphochlamys debaryana]|eukprot:KAG2496157.1 hypothetical protein HYH03_005759 [Edaphochlamys debaryana]